MVPEIRIRGPPASRRCGGLEIGCFQTVLTSSMAPGTSPFVQVLYQLHGRPGWNPSSQGTTALELHDQYY